MFISHLGQISKSEKTLVSFGMLSTMLCVLPYYSYLISQKSYVISNIITHFTDEESEAWALKYHGHYTASSYS